MITKLHLHNWQCHQDRVMSLDRVTVLVGDNDTGKSAVLRALRWLALGEWDGEAGEYITWGEKDCVVSAIFDGQVVSRHRDGDKNYYLLDGDYLHGASVPSAVADLLRLGPDNFQCQGDPPFWLGLTSGQAASALNDLFCLSKVDDALDRAGSELRQANARARVCEERLTEAKKKARELNWIKEADRKLRDLEEMQSKLERLEVEKSRLTELLARAESLHELEAKYNKACGILHDCGDLKALEDNISMLRRLLKLKEEECQLIKQLEQSELRLAEVTKGKCPLCGRKDK